MKEKGKEGGRRRFSREGREDDEFGPGHVKFEVSLGTK